jgi:mRNA-degrading endonuclease toxin of MazEF toxin-antitoxin module
MQNDVGNNVSTITTVLPIISKINKNMMPTHVKIGIDTGLTMLSEITTEQVRSISKRRLLINGYVKKIGCLNNEQMNQVEEALSKQLGMKSLHYDNEFAEQLIKNIVITNQHIKKFNNTSLRPVLNFFYMELKKYCDSYNINYKDAIEMYLCKRKNINTNNIIFSKEKAM